MDKEIGSENYISEIVKEQKVSRAIVSENVESSNPQYQKIDELLQEYKQKYPESSLSISENTRNEHENVFSQIDDYLDNGIVPQERRFTLPKVPSYLKELGSDETAISLPVSVIKKARETHGLSNDEIKNSLTRLYDPVAVFDTDKTKSENKLDSKLILTDEFSESKPIALALNTNAQIQVEENGLCRYVDDKKISEWSTVARVYFPIEALHSDKNNILTKSEIVNQHGIVAENESEYHKANEKELEQWYETVDWEDPMESAEAWQNGTQEQIAYIRKRRNEKIINNRRLDDIPELQEALKDALKQTAVPLEKIEFTRDNYNKLFPYSKIETPIESVKMGEHQFEKLEAKERQNILLAVHDTLKNPNLIINEQKENVFGENEDNHIYAKSFLIDDKVHGVQSVVVSIDGENVSISTHERSINNIVNKIKKPDQLLFAAAKVRLLVERATGKQLVTVNPIRENEYVVSPQQNIQQKVDSVKQEENPIIKKSQIDFNKEIQNQVQEKKMENKMNQESELKEYEEEFDDFVEQIDANGGMSSMVAEDDYNASFEEYEDVDEDEVMRLEFINDNAETFKTLDDYLEQEIRPKNNEFVFSVSPKVLNYVEIPEHEIILTTGIISKAIKTHNLSNDDIRSALQKFSSPLAIFDSDKSKSENNVPSIVVVTGVAAKNNKPVALTLNLDSQRKGYEQKYLINEIRSIHDRTLVAKNGVNIAEEWSKNGLLKYIDDKKISSLGKEREDSFLLPLAKLDINNVKTYSDFVNQHNIVAENERKYQKVEDFSARMFTYNDFNFVAVRKFSEEERAFVNSVISDEQNKKLLSKNALYYAGFLESQKPVSEQKFEKALKVFNKADFLQSSNSDADIFYCREKGTFYTALNNDFLVPLEFVYSSNRQEKEVFENRFSGEIESFRNDNFDFLKGTMSYELDEKKDFALMSDISDVLSEGEVFTRRNVNIDGEIKIKLGELFDKKNPEKIQPTGLRHLIKHRMEERLNNGLSMEDAQRETTAILFLALNNIDKAPAIKEQNGRYAIYKDGIKTLIGKDKKGKYVVSGFDYIDTKREATDSIGTGIARYGYTPGFLEIYDQVGAVASELNIHKKNSVVNDKESEKIKTIKASQIMAEMSGFGTFSSMETAHKMIDYLYHRGAVAQAIGEIRDMDIIQIKLAENFTNEISKKGFLRQLQKYDNYLVEFDADGINDGLGMLELTDRDGAEKLRQELDGYKESYPKHVNSLSSENEVQQTQRQSSSIESPFKNADTEQIKELYEQAEAIEKMQQEATKNAVLEESKKYLRESEISQKQEFSLFDKELYLFNNGQLDENHVFNLGKPGEILKNCGFPENDRIELVASRLKIKASQGNHPFEIMDILGLDKALQNPIAVFEYGEKEKAQNVIVNLEKDGKNFLVGVFFNQKKDGFEVSSIRGLFNRDNLDWMRWIQQGKMIYGNKERIQVLANQQRTNLADVNSKEARTLSDLYYLDSLDNILQNFGDVKNIYTRDFPRYTEQKEKFEIFRQFRSAYQEKDSINIYDAVKDADEFYKAIKNNDKSIIEKFTNGIEKAELASVASLILENGGSHVQLKGINTQALNSNYSKDTLLSIKKIQAQLKSQDEIIDRGIESVQSNGGMSEAAMEAEIAAKNNAPYESEEEYSDEIDTFFYDTNGNPHAPQKIIAVLENFQKIEPSKWNLPAEEKTAVFHLIQLTKVDKNDFENSLAKLQEYMNTEEFKREDENYAKIFTPILLTSLGQDFDKETHTFSSEKFSFKFSTDDLNIENPIKKGEIKTISDNNFTGSNIKLTQDFQDELIEKGLVEPEEKFVLINEVEAVAKGTKIKVGEPAVVLTIPVDNNGKTVQTKYYHVSALEDPQNLEMTVEENSKSKQVDKDVIIYGKTKVPEFATITQHGLENFTDMIIDSYEESTNSYLLKSEDGKKNVRVTENTLKVLTSEEYAKKSEMYTQNTKTAKKMIDTQYNDFFQPRDNTANNFRHNLSVFCRKEANSPLDALKVANSLIYQMSKEEKQKTKELLNLLRKDGQTVNEVLIETYHEAVKEIPLNEDYIKHNRYEKMIARPMYDTLSNKGEKIDRDFNLKIGDSVDITFKVNRNPGPKFSLRKESIYQNCTIISASKEGNVVTLMDGNKSFYDVPRDTFLKEYAKKENLKNKVEKKVNHQKSMQIDIER